MGHSASVEPTRLTSSAKPSSCRAVVPGNPRVQSTPTSRKARRKDATVQIRCNGPNEQVSESDKSQTNGATNTLPSDVKLSPEVIVSISLKLTSFPCN